MAIEINQIIDDKDIYKAYPDILEKFGEEGRKRCREDNYHHFNNLEVAYKVQDVQIFELVESSFNKQRDENRAYYG